MTAARAATFWFWLISWPPTLAPLTRPASVRSLRKPGISAPPRLGKVPTITSAVYEGSNHWRPAVCAGSWHRDNSSLKDAGSPPSTARLGVYTNVPSGQTSVHAAGDAGRGGAADAPFLQIILTNCSVRVSESMQ